MPTLRKKRSVINYINANPIRDQRLGQRFEFVFSDDIEKWKQGKATKKAKPLF